MFGISNFLLKFRNFGNDTPVRRQFPVRKVPQCLYAKPPSTLTMNANLRDNINPNMFWCLLLCLFVYNRDVVRTFVLLYDCFCSLNTLVACRFVIFVSCKIGLQISILKMYFEIISFSFALCFYLIYYGNIRKQNYLGTRDNNYSVNL